MVYITYLRVGDFMQELENNRLRQRHQYKHHVLCYRCEADSLDEKPKVPFVFEITDISYGGMGITTENLISPGCLLYFTLNAGASKREFSVQVKWCRYTGYNYTMGVAFRDVIREDILFLYQIVSRLS